MNARAGALPLPLPLATPREEEDREVERAPFPLMPFAGVVSPEVNAEDVRESASPSVTGGTMTTESLTALDADAIALGMGTLGTSCRRFSAAVWALDFSPFPLCFLCFGYVTKAPVR